VFIGGTIVSVIARILENAYRFLVWKPTGRGPLRRPRQERVILNWLQRIKLEGPAVD
jgi:hypothetical protein